MAPTTYEIISALQKQKNKPTYDPVTGQFTLGIPALEEPKPEPLPPAYTTTVSPSEITTGAKQALDMRMPQFTFGQDKAIPEVPVSLAQDVIRPFLSGSFADTYQQVLGQQEPMPAPYQPDYYEARPPSIKQGLKDFLKRMVPGYPQEEARYEYERRQNMAIRNAAEAKRYTEEMDAWQVQQNQKRLIAYQTAQMEHYQAADDMAIMRFQEQAKQKQNELYIRQQAVDNVRNKVFNDSIARYNFLEEVQIPLMRARGAEEDEIEALRMSSFSKNLFDYLYTKDPLRRAQALDRWHEEMGEPGLTAEQKNWAVMGKWAMPSTGGGGAAQLDQAGVDRIADGMVRGTLPPEMTRLYGASPRVLESIARRYPDFNLSEAQVDWTGTRKYAGTMNAQAVTRTRQAIAFTRDINQYLSQYIDDWKEKGGISRFKILNSANLMISRNVGGELGASANNLQAMVNTLIQEVAAVLSFGYASTDVRLKLAAAEMQENWDEPSLRGGVKRIEQLMSARDKELVSGTPVVPSGESRYWKGGATPTGKKKTQESEITRPPAKYVVGKTYYVRGKNRKLVTATWDDEDQTYRYIFDPPTE